MLPRLFLISLCLLAPRLVGAHASDHPTFAGVMAGQGRTLVLLTHGTDTRWVAVGGAFGNYRITSLDAKTDTLTLTAPDNTTVQLPLKDSKVQAGATSAVSQKNAELWAKIKDLDGPDLVKALIAYDSGRSHDAIVYLAKQSDRLQKQAAQARQAVEELRKTEAADSDAAVRRSQAERHYEAALNNATDIQSRLEQIALHEKKMIRDSAIGPDPDVPVPAPSAR